MAISDTSPHFDYWRKVKHDLKNMYFVDGNNKLRSPSLCNWLVTINGVEELYTMLPSEMKHLPGRSLNQDPLENFFGQIRQRGSRNTNPTPTMFQYHFKSLIINNLASVHSINANCEEDCNQMFAAVKKIIIQESTSSSDEGSTSNIDNMIIPAIRTNHITNCNWLCMWFRI